MTTNQPPHRFEIGMVGLGVMGRNLVLNMADHGFPWRVMTRTRPRSRRCGQESAEPQHPRRGEYL